MGAATGPGACSTYTEGHEGNPRPRKPNEEYAGWHWLCSFSPHPPQGKILCI